MIKAQTLKGFRDFLPTDALKRQFVIGKIKEMFERFGFDPLETPALEYAETLLGKYGDEADKMLYLFKDRGGRKVGMRFDQTVPTARVIAQYAQELPMPFKRYQIQPVWRAENTQKGRFREFLQCDADIIGTSSPLADAEILQVLDATLKNIGFNKYEIRFNSRDVLFKKIKDAGIPENLTFPVIRTVDKINKIGWDEVNNALVKIGVNENAATKLNDLLSLQRPIESKNLNDVWELCSNIRSLKFDPSLARGLDYYTGIIFEVTINEYDAGSVAGGGRYDNLIGMFSDQPIPAVGFAFGFDRLIEAMEQLQLLPVSQTTTQALVTVFSEALLPDTFKLTSLLRDAGINAEIAIGAEKLDKQLKYADKKGIPYVIIQGPDEVNRNVVKLKNMETKKQEELTIDKVIAKLQSN